MKSYLINLDRSPERLDFFARRAAAIGLDFERVAAVDGKLLGAAEIDRIRAAKFEFQPLNRGEIGAFLSHRRVWQTLVGSGDSFAAIFEDDVLLADGIGAVLSAIDAIRPDADIIKLETTLRDVVLATEAIGLKSGHKMRKLLSWHGGAAGYVISNACAARLLNLTDPVADPVDQVLFNPLSRVSRQLDILQVEPAPCVQHDILDRRDGPGTFPTTIERDKTRRRLFRHGPLIDARRTVKRLREAARRRALAARPGNTLETIAFAGTE